VSEKVSGLVVWSSRWSQCQLEVELLCDALNPGLVARRCVSVDAGTYCVPFRGGQWLVDPRGPAEKAGHRPGGESERISFGLVHAAVDRTRLPVLGSLNPARPLRPHAVVLSCRELCRDLLSGKES
jgi:hypothetical protein